MKLNKYIFGVLALALFLSLNTFAQEKMTKDEWKAEMSSLTEKKASLTNELNTLRTDVNNLKNTKVGNVDDCYNEIYTMIGASKSDVDNFRRALADLDGKIRRNEGPKAERQKDLNTLKVNKITALPEFFDKVMNEEQALLDAWVEAPKDINYTVVKGDCLWNIAKKKEHYGNALAWPTIYNANRDQIKDPDLIFPKQTFKIPQLTEEEKAKYEKLRKN
ncbi:MAG: LysM peptidoglycan-binding domain-containing protein, partial [Bacteroidota bacterium]|nr:LysM peptidoglycan-binding domain-containing protein [Bacteroidota bacterium]